MATLKDVAALAGVSVKTVSNVVNDYPFVSDGVRRRVRQAVETLHYRPNRSARELRAGRDGVLTLALPATGHPYGDDLADAFRRAARERGRRLVVEHVEAEHGGPATASDDHRPAAPTALLAAGGVQVLLGGVPDGRCDRVTVDLVRAARDAAEHLRRSGRERIALIEHPRPTAHDDAAEHPAEAGGHGRAAGYRAARALLSRRPHPDGLVCASDLLAIGAVRAVFDAGLRVPEDVAVVGFGDLDEGRWARPTLSTVAVDQAGAARAAIALLADRLARPGAPPVEIVAPHVLLPRESSAGPPRRRTGAAATGRSAGTGRRTASRSDVSSPGARSAVGPGVSAGG